MSPEEFEALIRRELAQRDSRRRARLGDHVAQTAADQMCVDAIMQAAGYGPSEDSKKVLAKAARRAKVNEDAAFEGAAL